MSKNFRKNLLWSLLSLVLLTILSYFIISEDRSFYSIVTISFLISFFFSVLLAIILENWDLTRENRCHIDARMGQIIEYFALSTSNIEGSRRFEYVLEKMREEKGNVKWVIAKFISRKMCKHFKKPEEADIYIPDVDTDNFLSFIEEIISECETSLQWTCPYTPEDWFTELIDDSTKLEKFIDGEDLQKLNLDDNYASKFNKILNMRRSNVDMTRIVNLSGSEIEKITQKCDSPVAYKRQKRFLDEFIRINGTPDSCNLFFVNIDSYTNTDAIYGKDYGIYDNKVVIFYEPEDEIKGTEGKLFLELDKVDNYCFLFTNTTKKIGDTYPSGVKGAKEIQKLFEEKNSTNTA